MRYLQDMIKSPLMNLGSTLKINNLGKDVYKRQRKGDTRKELPALQRADRRNDKVSISFEDGVHD